MTSFGEGTAVRFNDNLNREHRGTVLYRIPGKSGQRITLYKVRDSETGKNRTVSFRNLLQHNKD